MNPAHHPLTKVQDLTPICGLQAVPLRHKILVSSLSFIIIFIHHSLFSKLQSAHLQRVIEFHLPEFESYATFWHKSEMQPINDVIQPSDYRQIFQFSLLKVTNIQAVKTASVFSVFEHWSDVAAASFLKDGWEWEIIRNNNSDNE